MSSRRQSERGGAAQAATRRQARIGLEAGTGPEAGIGPEARIGGIALRNGLVLLSEHNWAAAIREPDGSISVASGPKPRLVKGAVEGWPLLRGLGRFGESLLVLALVKARLSRAELPLEGGRIAAALGSSLAATVVVRSLAKNSPLAEEIGATLAAFLPAVVVLRDSPITGYHGAEHVLIGHRERELGEAGRLGAGGSERLLSADDRPEGRFQRDLGPEPKGAPGREHDRCGTNLVGPYMVATVATNLLLRRFPGGKSPLASAAAAAISLGAALEVLRWASRHGDSLAARLILWPGRAVQRHLTTAEPTPEQLEVGRRALEELVRLDGELAPAAATPAAAISPAVPRVATRQV